MGAKSWYNIAPKIPISCWTEIPLHVLYIYWCLVESGSAPGLELEYRGLQSVEVNHWALVVIAYWCIDQTFSFNIKYLPRHRYDQATVGGFVEPKLTFFAPLGNQLFSPPKLAPLECSKNYLVHKCSSLKLHRNVYLKWSAFDSLYLNKCIKADSYVRCQDQVYNSGPKL